MKNQPSLTRSSHSTESASHIPLVLPMRSRLRLRLHVHLYIMLLAGLGVALSLSGCGGGGQSDDGRDGGDGGDGGPPTSGQNLAPTARAGSDQSVPVGTLVTLNGAQSSDPEGSALTYAWSFVSRPVGSSSALVGGDRVESSFTPETPGEYVVQLVVNDGAQNSDPDLVQVTVTASPGDQVVVPDVVGMTQSAALAALASARLTAATTTAHSDAVPAGTVISQSPSPGTLVEVGATVNVVVSLGPTGSPPPDPRTLAPPLDTTGITAMSAALEFLHRGGIPLQTGVLTGAIDEERVALVRGRVLKADGAALENVTITINGAPGLGETRSRADGLFDLVVNGGAPVVVNYVKPGYLPAQRSVTPEWQTYVTVDDVILIGLDVESTTIELGSQTAVQVARGSLVTDAAGPRRSTIIFPGGVTASMLVNGASFPFDGPTITVRSTEYTVGERGPQRMPAVLPPTSGYTYAVEMSADEAMAAGATRVSFDRPLHHYVENFLGFPVGSAVPTGYYDRDKAAWIPSENGRVVKVTAISNGLAELDTDGDTLADNDAALAITDGERAKLATLYAAGAELWRVPISHFTPWDHNWPYGPPEDAEPPELDPLPDQPFDPSNCQRGSIIDCQNQVLGETIDVVGAPFKLHYDSARVRGRRAAYSLRIPLSSGSIPTSLLKIDLEISVAGRRFVAEFPASTNQFYDFEWDGEDAFGREMQGSQRVVVRIGYHYPTVFYSVQSDFERAFSQATSGQRAGSISLSPNASRSALILRREWIGSLGSIDMRTLGLGGWAPSIQHFYESATGTLHYGDGLRRRIGDLNDSGTMTHVAGKQNGSTSNNAPAKDAAFNPITALAVAPDGTLYVAEGARVRRITRDGTVVNVVSGIQACVFNASQRNLQSVTGLAFGPDGQLYISDRGCNAVYRVAPDGSSGERIAGLPNDTGAGGYDGDNKPAVAAQLNQPTDITVGSDGSVYIADTNNRRVRRVDPGGFISTVAGTGVAAFDADGGPAQDSTLAQPQRIALDASGNVYVSDTKGAGNDAVWRIDSSGIMSLFAGTGAENVFPASDATTVSIGTVRDLTVGTDGTLYVQTTAFGEASRLFEVLNDGNIRILAGLVGSSPGIVSTLSENRLARQVALESSYHIAVGGRRIYISTRLPEAIWAVTGLPISTTQIADDRSYETYEFDAGGRHLRTLHSLTGAKLFEFGYDPDGRLISILDAAGNVTTIERLAGAPTAIVAPGGQRTLLTLSADGYLSALANPAGEVVELGYYDGSARGLLRTFKDARALVQTFGYDALGRLTEDANPQGGSTTLTQTTVLTAAEVSRTVTLTRPMGQAWTYKDELLANRDVRRTVTEPWGAKTITLLRADGTISTTRADGVVVDIAPAADPRFGMWAPFAARTQYTYPDGLTQVLTRTRSVGYSGGLFSTQTEEIRIGGATHRLTYDASTRAFTHTSAGGRTSARTIDGAGRVTAQSFDGGATPVAISYDGKGLIERIERGTQSWSYLHDAGLRAVSVADASGAVRSMRHDDADRVDRVTLPSGRAFRGTYDASGSFTALILPDDAQHVMGYGAMERFTSYAPPGGAALNRSHDADGRLRTVTLPSGAVITSNYEVSGRYAGISYPGAEVVFAHADDTRRVAALTRTPNPNIGPAQSLEMTYSGGLLTTLTASGMAGGTFEYQYETGTLRWIGLTTKEGALTRFATTRNYDDDALLTSYGAFTLTRDMAFGNPGRIAANGSNVALEYTYDGLGRMRTRRATNGANVIFGQEFSYDVVGRITRIIEGGAVYDFRYDADGRLEEVEANDVVIESYAYDPNGRRTSASGTAESHDAEQRLDARGAIDYRFDADGYLEGRGTDIFDYSRKGELLSATANGKTIGYGYDGLHRRVARMDGAATMQYFYADPTIPTAVTHTRSGSGEWTQYLYDDGGRVFALERAGARYLIATDLRGSPRRVIHATDGTIVKAIDYDSFGQVTGDSAPAFDLALGYGGGLYDPDTGLVRFTWRDYEPASGTWTARDAALFGGGQVGLYVYANHDPINYVDPSGFLSFEASAYRVLGGGIKIGLTTEGFSFCAEAGLGVGAGIGVDPMAELDPNLAIGLRGELSAKLGLLKAKAGVNADLVANDAYNCFKRVIGGDTTGCFAIFCQGIDTQGNAPTTLDTPLGLDEGQTWKDFLKGGGGIGVEGKLAARSCIKQAW